MVILPMIPSTITRLNLVPLKIEMCTYFLPITVKGRIHIMLTCRDHLREDRMINMESGMSQSSIEEVKRNHNIITVLSLIHLKEVAMC